MTAPSKPKTDKTGYIAAAFAAVLSLGSCAISDFSVTSARYIEFDFSAPAPKSNPTRSSAPKGARLEPGRIGSQSGGRIAVVCRPRGLYHAAIARLRSKGKNDAERSRPEYKPESRVTNWKGNEAAQANCASWAFKLFARSPVGGNTNITQISQRAAAPPRHEHGILSGQYQRINPSPSSRRLPSQAWPPIGPASVLPAGQRDSHGLRACRVTPQRRCARR